MDTALWRAKIKPGQQALVREWMDFLRLNREEGEKTLINEREYLEAYFISEENAQAYLYIFVSAESLEYANKVAATSKNPLDVRHFEYMSACLDGQDYVQLRPQLTLSPGFPF